MKPPFLALLTPATVTGHEQAGRVGTLFVPTRANRRCRQGMRVGTACPPYGYAYDSGAERPVTFRVAVEEATRQLIGRLP